MNISSLIDWVFFWDVFENIVASAIPFVLIVVAIAAAGFLLGILIESFGNMRRG